MVQPTRGSRGEHRLAEASGVRNHGMSICCAKCQLEWKCLPRRWYYFSVVYGGKLAEDIRRSSTEVSVQKRRKNHTHHTRFKRVHQFWAISWNHIKLNFCSVEELLFSWRTSVQFKTMKLHYWIVSPSKPSTPVKVHKCSLLLNHRLICSSL